MKKLIAYIVTTFIVCTSCQPDTRHEDAFALLEKGDVQGLQQMIKADPNIVASKNRYGMPLFLRACTTDQLPCIKLLVDSGADLKVRDKVVSRTPLHFAAGWSTLDVVKFLVENGADVTATTTKNDTPLSFAKANFYQGNDTQRKLITEYLIKKGAR